MYISNIQPNTEISARGEAEGEYRGMRLYIADIHQEAMLHILYSIVTARSKSSTPRLTHKNAAILFVAMSMRSSVYSTLSFCLLMDELMEDKSESRKRQLDDDDGSDHENVRPKKRLSLALPKKRQSPSKKRFTFNSSPSVDKYKKKMVPANTERSTKWCLSIYDDWIKARTKAGLKLPPSDLLIASDGELLCQWLCRFFTEVRKSNGESYCPRSLSSLLAGLQRYHQSNSPHQLNIQERNGVFEPLHILLENLYKELHSNGIGTVTSQAAVISIEEEAKLWDSGALGSDNPESLLNAVFYLNGINFTLRGGAEHRNLKLSQLTFGHDPPKSGIKGAHYVEYKEFGSKNRPGGKKQLNLQNKTVRYYSQPSLGCRCHVYLIDCYIAKLPEEAIKKDIFYCRPLKKFEKGKPWYCSVPLGHNCLAKKLKDIFTSAGIDHKGKSNHSLRATSISRMYRADVPEKLIMERSGHLSTEGVRSYERTSAEQTKKLCDTLSGVISEPSTSTSSGVVEEKPAETSEAESDASAVMRQLNFQGMSSCNFTFNFNYKK